MTEIAKEILEKYQIRKTNAQKTAFIDFLRGKFPGLTVESGGLLKSRNLVVGDAGTADVIFTAHYDTCAELPFPNVLTPKNFLLYLLYNVLVIVPVFLGVWLVSYGMARLTENFWVSYWSGMAVLVLFLFLLFAGKANPHTANDNTSGVVTLCALLTALDDQERARAAFVFFDNEEVGLVGSALFKKMHRAALARRLVVNLDCVSDGDTIMVIQNKRARQTYGDALRRAFCAAEGKEIRLEKASAVFYPSDQIHFPCNAAIAAFRRSKVFGYYLDKIHTKRDTCFDERNIDYLCGALRRLLHEIGNPSA